MSSSLSAYAAAGAADGGSGGGEDGVTVVDVGLSKETGSTEGFNVNLLPGAADSEQSANLAIERAVRYAPDVRLTEGTAEFVSGHEMAPVPVNGEPADRPSEGTAHPGASDGKSESHEAVEMDLTAKTVVVAANYRMQRALGDRASGEMFGGVLEGLPAKKRILSANLEEIHTSGSAVEELIVEDSVDHVNHGKNVEEDLTGLVEVCDCDKHENVGDAGENVGDAGPFYENAEENFRKSTAGLIELHDDNICDEANLEVDEKADETLVEDGMDVLAGTRDGAENEAVNIEKEKIVAKFDVNSEEVVLKEASSSVSTEETAVNNADGTIRTCSVELVTEEVYPVSVELGDAAVDMNTESVYMPLDINALNEHTPVGLSELNVGQCSEGGDNIEIDSSFGGSPSMIEPNCHVASYNLLSLDSSSFQVSDLVWGKVKSHPWWPGQIVDPSNASELALRYQKRDTFLVAYFGDKTFAWCEESQLKPFAVNFTEMEKQGATEAFTNSVHESLAEVAVRIEIGMSCSCLHDELSSSGKLQKIENAGVQDGVKIRRVNHSQVINCFQPANLLDFVKSLACQSSLSVDRLELLVTRSQLKAFYHSKGYADLPVFISSGPWAENDLEAISTEITIFEEAATDNGSVIAAVSVEKPKKRRGRPPKRKHNEEDEYIKKGSADALGSVRKLEVTSCKGPTDVDFEFGCNSGNRKKRSVNSLFMQTKHPTQTIGGSFKIGECISRVATKLTGAPTVLKSPNESVQRNELETDDKFDVFSEDTGGQTPAPDREDSPAELLPDLGLAATDVTAHTTVKTKRGRKRKVDITSPADVVTDHMQDAYWSDLTSPEQTSHGIVLRPRRGRQRKISIEMSAEQLAGECSATQQHPHVGVNPATILKSAAERRIMIHVEEKKVDERKPSALIMSFGTPKALPSRTDLIRIFSRYGPLREGDTEVQTDQNRAKVVFKRRMDAEIAFSNAGKLSLFGRSLLSYRLADQSLSSQASSSEIKVHSNDDKFDEDEETETVAFTETTVMGGDFVTSRDTPSIMEHSIETTDVDKMQLDEATAEDVRMPADDDLDEDREMVALTETTVVGCDFVTSSDSPSIMEPCIGTTDVNKMQLENKATAEDVHIQVYDEMINMDVDETKFLVSAPTLDENPVLHAPGQEADEPVLQTEQAEISAPADADHVDTFLQTESSVDQVGVMWHETPDDHPVDLRQTEVSVEFTDIEMEPVALCSAEDSDVIEQMKASVDDVNDGDQNGIPDAATDRTEQAEPLDELTNNAGELEVLHTEVAEVAEDSDVVEQMQASVDDVNAENQIRIPDAVTDGIGQAEPLDELTNNASELEVAEVAEDSDVIEQMQASVDDVNAGNQNGMPDAPTVNTGQAEPLDELANNADDLELPHTEEVAEVCQPC